MSEEAQVSEKLQKLIQYKRIPRENLFDGFDEEDVSTDGGPGQSGRDAGVDDETERAGEPIDHHLGACPASDEPAPRGTTGSPKAASAATPL